MPMSSWQSELHQEHLTRLGQAEQRLTVEKERGGHLRKQNVHLKEKLAEMYAIMKMAAAEEVEQTHNEEVSI